MTEWIRYIVFQQDKPNRPHQSAGSVHAPDAELALLNGRDVFVRRPRCHSLWVAPVHEIFAKTAQELERQPDWFEAEAVPSEAQPETYLVFKRTTKRRTMENVTHIGQLEARTPAEALHKSIDTLGKGNELLWWVVRETAVLRSEDDDIASMFIPAESKDYRMPNEYHTVFELNKLKHGATT